MSSGCLTTSSMLLKKLVSDVLTSVSRQLAEDRLEVAVDLLLDVGAGPVAAGVAEPLLGEWSMF